MEKEVRSDLIWSKSKDKKEYHIVFTAKTLNALNSELKFEGDTGIYLIITIPWWLSSKKKKKNQSKGLTGWEL